MSFWPQLRESCLWQRQTSHQSVYDLYISAVICVCCTSALIFAKRRSYYRLITTHNWGGTSLSCTTTHPCGEFCLLVSLLFLQSHTSVLAVWLIICDERCVSHLQDGPIEAQQDAPWFIPNRVLAVREAAQEELVAQTTPAGQTLRRTVNRDPSCRDFYFVILTNNVSALCLSLFSGSCCDSYLRLYHSLR